MRCHKKRSVFFGVLFLLAVFYLNSPVFLVFLNFEKRAPEWAWFSSTPLISSKESWVDQGGFLPLNVSHQLLAGTPVIQDRFLAVGLASVKRKKGSYLLPTLRSLFTHSSPEERSSMVVVLLLADFDDQWREATVGEIKAAFTPELNQGQLLVVHVPQQYYPPLTGLKRNFNDAAERVSFRSKQNVDYSFLMHYCTGLGRYYLQLEDDVSSAQHFLSTIRKHVLEQETKSANWVTLEFSSLGYIGKLYRSLHLPLLSRFLFLFYQEMPCDWLLSHFRLLLTQKESILFKPSLFQHMGTFSSFKGSFNKLKDKDFEEDVYMNPSAEVYSDMSVFKDHSPEEAWVSGTGFFWGKAPEVGNYLTVVFIDPVIVTEVTIETGSEGKDRLDSAVVKLGFDPVKTEKGERTCQRFHLLGKLENGIFNMQAVDKTHDTPSSCLSIEVTGNQKDWVIIQKIRIKPKT